MKVPSLGQMLSHPSAMWRSANACINKSTKQRTSSLTAWCRRTYRLGASSHEHEEAA